MTRRRLLALALAGGLAQLSCIPGVYDPTAEKPSFGPVEGPRIVAPGGQTRLRAYAFYTAEPIEWKLDPVSAGTFVQEPTDVPPAPIVRGGPAPTSPAQTGSAIRFTAGPSTGVATFSLTVRNSEGPVSTTATVRIVPALSLRLLTTELTLGPGVMTYLPVSGGPSVWWSEAPGSPGTTSDVPQWLRAEPIGPFGDGTVENLSSGYEWTSPSLIRVKTPSSPGIYRLKVTALGDPKATVDFTLTVR